MTIYKRYTAPTLPLPPADYAQTYGNELIKVLRLYFDNNDATVNAILALLNAGGYFPELVAGTVTAETINATTLNSLYAAIQQIQASNVIASGFVGGNAILNNLSASNAQANLFTGAGYQLNFPHIAASGSTDQYAGGDNTPTIVQWDSASELLGFTLNNDYTATADHPGVYKIDYSLQFANTDNAPHDVFIWLQVDGVNVAGSSSKFTIRQRKSVGDYAYIVAYSSLTFEIAANKKIGLWWATDKAYSTTGPIDGVFMEDIVAQTSPPYDRPANPAAVGSIVYVSAPKPPLTKVVPVGVQGYGKVGSVGIDIKNNT